MRKVIIGKLEACSQPAENRYGILVGGEWFNGFGSNPFRNLEGKIIKVEYEEVIKKNGIYRNVISVSEPQNSEIKEEKKEEEKQNKNQTTLKDVFIARSVALKAAIESMGTIGGGDDIKLYLNTVKEIAAEYEAWLMRD